MLRASETAIHFVRLYAINDWNSIKNLTQKINQETGCLLQETGVASALRALRKRKNGGFLVDKQYLGEGVYVYRARQVPAPGTATKENPDYELGRSAEDGPRVE